MNTEMGQQPLVRIFKCDTCKKIFTRSDSLKRHSRLHTGEKPYECGTCAKRFADGGNFLKHLRQYDHSRLSDKH